MTLNELKNDVARLGFESYVEDEECFIASANRALSLIYVDRPVSKVARINLRGPRVGAVHEFIEHLSGDVITIPISGKSLSFRSYGKGTCVIKDSSGSSTIPLIQNGQLTRQFIYGEGTITFSGDYYFTVSSLAVYLDLLSDKAVDIPEYGPYLELSPDDYCGGFRSFVGYPTDSNGKKIDEIKLMDGRILAPFDYRGELYLTYYRTPTPINSTDTVSAIDVSDECAPLLPLLTASFLWLDDDAAKAQYYMSLYRDLVANVKRYSNNKIDTAYSTEGWA